MKTLIVIPARFASKRFPGKPLAILVDKPILLRVWEIANYARQRLSDCNAVVATETPTPDCQSDKIVEFCHKNEIPVVTTSNACRSGSDRVWQVAQEASERPDVVVNLQGDAPTCPPDFIVKLVESLESNPAADVASVMTTLSWDALDALREAKRTSPFSGTTVVVNEKNEALWFSKNIIPAIRDEEKLRATDALSPVRRHVGLYAYRYDALRFFANTEKGQYERLEQLEQLRFLEHGRAVQMIEGEYPPGYDHATSGVDTPEDLARVERLIRAHGELLDFYR